MSKERKKFFNKLKKEGYTILAPNMLPTHFELFEEVLKKEGYKVEILLKEGREIINDGLKNIHNDACYPALLVVGAFINALDSGKYDLSKTAVIITQTGGGCRASNYYSLIQKALKKKYPMVPVISLNVSGLEKDRSLPFTLPLIFNLLSSVMYGDLIMLLYNQVKPYEIKKGETDKVKEEVFKTLKRQVMQKGFNHKKKNYRYILDSFRKIKLNDKKKEIVGVVGEIYVKYSALANNHLNDFLLSEGVEPYSPSLMEFLLYCLENTEEDYKLYKRNKVSHLFVRPAYWYLVHQSRIMNKMIEEYGFRPYENFEEIKENGKEVINEGVKMGEGWLIPSEMVTMAKHNVHYIVCTQPFGCLPNHIVGKGMMRPIKEKYPDVHIAAIDYDSGATKVNQENRIKLLLSSIEK